VTETTPSGLVITWLEEPCGQVPVQATGYVQRGEDVPRHPFYFRARGGISVAVWPSSADWPEAVTLGPVLPQGECWELADWPEALAHRWSRPWTDAGRDDAYPGWMAHDCARELCIDGLERWAAEVEP
jgi:hypothetical protein